MESTQNYLFAFDIRRVHNGESVRLEFRDEQESLNPFLCLRYTTPSEQLNQPRHIRPQDLTYIEFQSQGQSAGFHRDNETGQMELIETDRHDFTSFTPITSRLIADLRNSTLLNVPDILYSKDEEGERALLWDYFVERFKRKNLTALFVDRWTDKIIARFGRSDYTELELQKYLGYARGWLAEVLHDPFNYNEVFANIRKKMDPEFSRD